MALTKNQKWGIGIGATIVVGGGIATAIYFYNKNEKEKAGTGVTRVPLTKVGDKYKAQVIPATIIGAARAR